MASASSTPDQSAVIAPPKSFLQKTVWLKDWWLIKSEDEQEDKKFRGKRLAVAGFAHGEQKALRVFSSAPIVKRHDVFNLETSDGVRVIIKGFLDKGRTEENGFPSEVSDHFIFGFPAYWEVYVKRLTGEQPVHEADGESDLNLEKISLQTARISDSLKTVQIDEDCGIVKRISKEVLVHSEGRVTRSSSKLRSNQNIGQTSCMLADMNLILQDPVAETTRENLDAECVTDSVAVDGIEKGVSAHSEGKVTRQSSKFKSKQNNCQRSANMLADADVIRQEPVAGTSRENLDAECLIGSGALKRFKKDVSAHDIGIADSQKAMQIDDIVKRFSSEVSVHSDGRVTRSSSKFRSNQNIGQKTSSMLADMNVILQESVAESTKGNLDAECVTSPGAVNGFEKEVSARSEGRVTRQLSKFKSKEKNCQPSANVLADEDAIRQEPVAETSRENLDAVCVMESGAVKRFKKEVSAHSEGEVTRSLNKFKSKQKNYLPSVSMLADADADVILQEPEAATSGENLDAGRVTDSELNPMSSYKGPEPDTNHVVVGIKAGIQKKSNAAKRSSKRVTAADKRRKEPGVCSIESPSKDGKASSTKVKRKLAYESPVPRIAKVSVHSPETSSFKRSRSGRLLLPTMEFWNNQRAIYDADGKITGVEEGMCGEMPGKGSRSEPPRMKATQII